MCDVNSQSNAARVEPECTHESDDWSVGKDSAIASTDRSVLHTRVGFTLVQKTHIGSEDIRIDIAYTV